MLESYISAGFDPDLFWALTPRLYVTHMQGARMRFEREHNERAWVAWHTAYLPKLKKPVGLQELLIGYTPKAKGWKEQLAAWTAYANYKAH